MCEVRQEACAHRQRGGVRVEDVDPELLQRFLEDHVHHGVVLAVLRLQVGDLDTGQRHNISVWVLLFFYTQKKKSENLKLKLLQLLHFSRPPSS